MNLRIAMAGIMLSNLLASNGVLQAETVYDFASGAGVDRFAYHNSISELAIPPASNAVPATPFSPADYSAVALSDDVRFTTGIIEGGMVPATRYVFTIADTAASITQIDVLWEGGANEGEMQSVWLWNNTTNSYTLVGSQNTVTPPDGVVATSFVVNPSRFLDAGNLLTVLVTYNVPGASLMTDHLSVTITGPQCFNDADCDDGLYCNGIETCAGGLCWPSTPIFCDDGIPCTVDSCNEATDSCDHTPSDAACDDGVYCNGVETCDPVTGCQSGTPVDCDDGIACTTDSCNELAKACDHIPDAPGCLAPSTWYVDADATGTNDGKSWLDAFVTLQDAEAAAGYGDEIWVAAGTYKPDEGAGWATGDVSALFVLRNGVGLYGHFLGTETTLADRDLTNMADPLRQTILSGDIGNPGLMTDNSTHVAGSSGVDDTTLLDAFTVRDGNAWDVLGYGGGLYIASGSPTISRCTFTANGAGAMGGGVNNYNGTPTLIECVFDGNTADWGGGMANQWGSVVLIDCTFTANIADEKGAGMGEMFGDSTLIGCTFMGNQTVAVSSMGGGLYVHNWASASLTNCLFSGNSADHGGGMLSYGPTTLANCTFSLNHATYTAGGYGTYGWSSTLTNCVFWGNTGGGTTIERRQVFGGGPSLSVDYSCVEGLTGSLGGVGNTGGDPLFVNALGADMLPGTADDDLHLGAGSSCIDAGDGYAVPMSAAIDLDGNARFFDDPGTADSGNGGPPIVDLGVYEFGAGPLVSGDVDCDGTLTMSDVQALVDVLLGSDTTACHMMAADIEGDGIADGGDIEPFVALLVAP